jgi:purine-binding chemotaxis protein CheW
MSEIRADISHKERQIFGSFYLDDNEFALAVSYVQEVVNAPTHYISVPLSPNFLKGLFNLRGIVIPVLDLRELIQLKGGSSNESQKIAIIELDGSCVGLIFDRTGEIFRSNEEERSDFDSSHASGIISGVFKKEAGNRIVQIMNVTKLFKLQNVPKDGNRLGRENLGQKRGQRKQCISFVVGPAKCSLPISGIHEILKINKLSGSTLGVGHCIGAIDLRGTTVPVIDFPALLQYRKVDRSETATQGDRRIIVMRLEKELFGLMVDSIDSIVSYFPDELITFPLVQQNRAEMFVGCITEHGDSDILLLDHEKILSNSEITEITHGHSKLYQSHSAFKDDKKSKGGARKTYITFTIDGTYAVAISDVKEIIDYPKQLLQPPGLPRHVRGILNLRGELVTIIDARNMYSTNQNAGQKEDQKVLVFSRNGIHFGLVVDSVESIITFAENDKIKLPEILYKSDKGSISADIYEAVEVTDTNGDKITMLILCVDSMAARASSSLAA